MRDHTRPKTAPPECQKSEQTAIDSNHPHEPRSLVGMAGAKYDRLQDQSGSRAAGPGAELLLQVAPKNDFLAQTGSGTKEQIDNDLVAPMRQQAARDGTAIGVQQVSGKSEDDAGENLKDDRDSEIAECARPTGPASSNQVAHGYTAEPDAKPDESND